MLKSSCRCASICSTATGKTLEQFRVVSFNIGDNVSASMERRWQKRICRRSCRCLKGGDKANFNWAPTWPLQGVTEVSSSQRRLPTF
ncbi:hypothetical protein MJK72_21605 [Klebsiella pneumoniae]|nr:hypothetical protein MJK72_21605 [Klebsiella pneumoniae]